MRRLLKVLIALVVILGVIAGMVVFTITNTNWGREQVRKQALSALANAVNGTVTVGRISGNLLTDLTLHDVSITDSAGAPFIKADEMHTGYGIRALLTRRIELRDVELLRPVIVLDKPPNAPWNFERIFPADTVVRERDTTRLAYGDWVVLHDVRIVDGYVTIRTPWVPDTALSSPQRHALAAKALRGETRTNVVKAPGGYQQVQEFRSVSGFLPLVRVAHPEHDTRFVQIDSLRAQALLFTPPAADVRHITGYFELNSDSLWFAVPEIVLPNSRLSSEGRYMLSNGDLAVRAYAERAAFADLRFAYPELPTDGSARFVAEVVLEGSKQHIRAHDVDLNTQGATASGKFGVTLGDTLYMHETDLTFARVPTRLIEQLLPGVDVPRQGLVSGHAIVDGRLDAMHVNGDVTFDDALSGRSRLLAVGELGAANGVFRARNLAVTLSPMQVDLARIAVDDLPIRGTVAGSAMLDGATNSQLVAREVDLTHVDRGERSRFTGRGAVRFAGGTFIDADFEARPVSLVTIGRFAPDAGLRGSVAGRAIATGPLDNLNFRTSLVASDGGLIDAQGTLDLANGDVGYDVQVATVLFNAHELVETAPITSVSGEASAQGRGFDPQTMRASISANLSMSSFDTVAVDSALVKVAIANGLLSVDTLQVRAPGAAVNATGTFGLVENARGSLAFDAQIDSLSKLQRYFPNDSGLIAPRPLLIAERIERARRDSAREAQRLAVARAAGAAPPASPIVVDTPPPVRRDSLAGKLQASGVLSGGVRGFDMRASVQAESLFVLGNAARRARAEIELTSALAPETTVRASASADSLFVAGFILDSVDARGTYKEPGGNAELAIFQNETRDYRIRADYAVYPDRKEVRIADLRMRFDTTRWASTQPGSILWGQPGIEVETIEVRSHTNGRIYVDGKLPIEGAANLELDIQNLQISDVLGMLQSDVPARGLLSVDVRVTGTSRSPTFTGSSTLAEPQYKGVATPDIQATFEYGNERLTAQASGKRDALQVFEAKGSFPVNLAFADVTGPRLPDAPATVELRADSLPLDIISRFTDVVGETGGYIVGKGALEGYIRSPDVSGDFEIRNAQARILATGVLLANINGMVHLRGDTVVIDSITAHSNGPIDLRGTIGIAQLTQPSFDLHLRANNANILDNDDARVVADGDIRMRGPFDATVVSGRAHVRQGVLYIPESDEKEVINAGDPTVFSIIDTTSGEFEELLPTQSPFLANLRMDLTLAVDRDTWIRSQEANIEVYSEGDLRINIDRRRETLTLDGVVTTDRGQYTFLGKRFLIKQGAVRFVGINDINPLLQVTAEYEVEQAGRPTINIRILIGGTMRSPRITLESDAQPPISQSDLLSYLAFGSESGSLLQFGGGSSLGGGTAGGGLVGNTAALAARQLASVALGALADQVEGEGTRSLGADVLNITPADIPPELATGNFGAFTTLLKGTQVEFGKYVNTRTFVGLNLTPTTMPGFRIQHQLRRRPGLSIESTFEPRFFLPEPSLATQDLRKANSFGLFLVRRWRF